MSEFVGYVARPPIPALFPDQQLIGNQGTAMAIPNDGRLITLADVKLADKSSPRTMIVSIFDKNDDSQGLVAQHDYLAAAILQYGHAGNAVGSGRVDIGHNQVFSVNASHLRVLGQATGGVAGQNARLCAIVTLGSSIIPANNNTIVSINGGAVTTIAARVNDIAMQVFTDAPYMLELLDSAGLTLFQKTYAAGSMAESVPPTSNAASWRITNLGVAAASFMYNRVKRF